MIETHRDPKVSVIIPNYNYAPYLAKRIESVLNQTYQDFEVIIIDDASSDNSIDIISGYLADKRIRTVFRKKNSGNLFKNWNLGVKQARGEYIWIAESDDYADTRFLEVLVSRLEQNPSAGLCYCQSLKVDETNNVIGSMQAYTDDLDPDRWKKSFMNNGRDECSRYLIYKNTIPNASAVLFRKRIYVQAGYSSESVYYGNDWRTWISLLLISDIVFDARPLNYYREHQHSVREKMDMTEFEIQSAYLVLRFIENQVALEKSILRKAFNHRVRSWVNIFFRGKGRINWKLNRYIFKMAKEIDPQLLFRFVFEFLVYPIKIMAGKFKALLVKLKKGLTGSQGDEEM